MTTGSAPRADLAWGKDNARPARGEGGWASGAGPTAHQALGRCSHLPPTLRSGWPDLGRSTQAQKKGA